MTQLDEIQKPPLLHNMSVPSKTTIAHTAPSGRVYGRGIVFAIPLFPGRRMQPLVLAELRSLLSLRLPRGADREQHLRDEMDRIAQQLELPACAMVSSQQRDGDEVCKDLPTVLTVIAKSSRTAYLRDKEPNLTALVPGTRIVLIVPKEKNDAT